MLFSLVQHLFALFLKNFLALSPLNYLPPKAAAKVEYFLSYPTFILKYFN